jgi:hypothetical protein
MEIRKENIVICEGCRKNKLNAADCDECKKN